MNWLILALLLGAVAIAGPLLVIILTAIFLAAAAGATLMIILSAVALMARRARAVTPPAAS